MVASLEGSSAAWVAYVGPVCFPEGGAAAQRILGNAKAIAATGRSVVVVSGQVSPCAEMMQSIAAGISCVSVHERDAEHLPKALRYLRYIGMGRRSRDWIEAQATPPEAIILYSGYAPYLLHFTGWARKRGIPLIFDAVEWYSARTKYGFFLSPYLWNTELAMRVLIPRIDGVITISHALDRYYQRRGMMTVRVPPLVDIAALPDFGRDAAPELRLAYAGSPGHKDYLAAVVSAVLKVDAGRGCVRLDIAGVTADELRRLPRMVTLPQKNLPANIQAHGAVSHGRALEIVQQADFSVFLRQVNRISTFGFPTKFVESIALGTPVIANITGDLADFLREGETGVVCRGPEATDLEVALARTLAMPVSRRSALRVMARAEAERAFDYREYVEPMAAFLDRLTASKDG